MIIKDFSVRGMYTLCYAWLTGNNAYLTSQVSFAEILVLLKAPFPICSLHENKFDEI